MGLIKPSWFNRLFKGNSNRKKVGLTFGIATFLFFVFFAMASPQTPSTQSNNTQTNNQTPVDTQQSVVPTQSQPVVTEPVKTPEQSFEDSIKPLVKNIGASDFSYRGIDWMASDTDKNSKMVTIRVGVGDFWSKDSLIRNTSELSSKLIEQSFKANMPINDVVVWYQGKVKDQYGNEKDDVVISHAMTKATAEKINWNGFDIYNLCDFLRSQSDEDICMVKPYIK